MRKEHPKKSTTYPINALEASIRVSYDMRVLYARNIDSLTPNL
jgi:hypothetical protein